MKTDIVNRFLKNQTLTNIQELKNAGIGLRILKNNQWEILPEYKLPFQRVIPLYDDNFEICYLGVY